jgi:photosystem II stability/assembly factor-like uncharacterized protein
MKKQLLFISLVALLFSCDTTETFINTLRVTSVYESDGELTEVYFINESTGFVIGKKGTVLTTFNGGETWNKVPVDDNSIIFNRISFPTATTGYISGSPDYILKTEDGGHTWTTFTGNQGVDYAYFPSADVGYGVNIQNNKIYKTVNGANSWTVTNFSNAAGLIGVDQVFFYTEDIGMAIDVNYGNYSMTYNGGDYWSNDIDDGFIGVSRNPRIVNDLAFWAVEENYSTYGGLFYTTDYGDNVERFPIEGLLEGNYLYFEVMNSYDGELFCACGNQLFAVSTDAGNTWTEFYNQNGVNFEMYDAAALTPSIFVGINKSTVYRITKF